MVVFEGLATIVKTTIFTKYARIFIYGAFVESGGGDDDLEGRSRFDHIDNGSVFHLFRFGCSGIVGVKAWAVCHSKDFAGFRIQHDCRDIFRLQFSICLVDFLLHNSLEVHIDGQVNIFSIFGFLFGSTIK